MSSDNIKLPDFVLVNLYKDCLVELEPVQEAKKSEPVKNIEKEELVAEPQPKAINYLGQNKKNVIVLVHETTAATIKENELDFLTKILTACNLNLADIAIINIHKQQVSFAEIKEQLNPKQVLFLGLEPTTIKLPFTIPHFQVQNYAGCAIVCTPPLADMLPNTPETKLLKSKLWISLKSAFNL